MTTASKVNRKMYGWRGRIGLIIPSSNTTMEPEFWQMAPKGVSIHTARMRLSNVTVDELIQMEKNAVAAAKLLATASVDLLVYGCTTGSLIKGPGYDREISEKLTRETGISSIATATAVLKALETLGAEKVALVTPYTKEVTWKEIEFLEKQGYMVVDVKYLGIKENTMIGKQEPYTAYRLAMRLDAGKADVVFISCTNFRTIEIIPILERDIGLPVFSSNTATMWMALKELGIKESLKGYGSLLDKY